LETHNKIASLIIKSRNSALNDNEQKELDDWLRLSEENRDLFNRLTDESYLEKLNQIDVRAERKKIMQRYERETGQSIPLIGTKKYLIAASILLVVAASAMMLYRSSVNNKDIYPERKQQSSLQLITDPKTVSRLLNEVTLTLANDSTIPIDKMANGATVFYENSYVTKVAEGQLQIRPATETPSNNNLQQSASILYNTLQIPRGRQYQLTLADGSVVWLNAFSSLRFPMSFNSNKRNVELSGEAYFEIKSIGTIKKMPFLVSAEGMNINVTGTRFNVNAYNDEKEIKTTLIEGAIEIIHGNTTTKITPRQQAKLAQNGQLTILNGEYTEEDIAWKNNLFVFRDASLQAIMRQLSRWYNIDSVSFNCCELAKYTTTSSRNKSLSETLAPLEATEAVHFEINGKHIIVSGK
jgi:ferric-dicitrate binding protein FerR (iron transport regulator)